MRCSPSRCDTRSLVLDDRRWVRERPIAPDREGRHSGPCVMHHEQVVPGRVDTTETGPCGTCLDPIQLLDVAVCVYLKRARSAWIRFVDRNQRSSVG